VNDLDLHAHLIGRQGSRRDLNTPVLVLDLDRLDRNIARMAEFAATHGLQLRPHAKTHKSVDIAKRQLAAGAIGQCCAKIGEAEALAEGGITGLHITSPVVPAAAVERLAALNLRSAGLMTVVDHPDNARAIARAVEQAGDAKLSVIIDIDPGIHRTGVASPQTAVELLEVIRSLPALVYRGLQFYCGSHQHIPSYAERETAMRERVDYLRTVIAALTEAGGEPAIVTGGGTGTHRIDAGLGVFTELQVGSYVFMDDEYRACDLTGEEGAPIPFETSLMIDTSVISANTPGLFTLDAGIKSMATDGPLPTVEAGADEAARFFLMGDEHGALMTVPGALALGDRVSLRTPHCDPTVNLYDNYHAVRGQTLDAIWPVSGRGRSR